MRWSGVAAIVLVAAAFAVRALADAPAVAPIVDGVLTTAYPPVGAFLAGTDPGTATTECSGVLVGCQTFLTAAHCVCESSGAMCQGGSAPAPDTALVFFDHAGFFSIASIAVPSVYVFPTAADVAVVRLAAPVTGIGPAAVNAAAVPLGTPATIVGFGVATVAADDAGLKRSGNVTTATCPVEVDPTDVCWNFTGTGSNTCLGDSGGPLLVDLGSGPAVAGVTSGGFANDCQAPDQSYDASLLAYQSFIQAASGGDVGTTACGGVPAVGDPGVAAMAFSSTLDALHPYDLHSFGIAAGTTELRVGMRGSEQQGVDFDLYVRGGAAPAAGAFDCRAVGSGQYGFCRIANPTSGSWFVRAERVAGSGVYQLVATTFGGGASVCGNGVREPGEDCDGSDVGTCDTGCHPDCTCVQCSPTDLDVHQIVLAPRLFVRAVLGDAAGTYTAIDPVTAGVTLLFTDGTHTVTVGVPPGDPGWITANPARGRYRWRGPRGAAFRRLGLRMRRRVPTQWIVTASGRHVPGARAIDYAALLVRMTLGTHCAERRFHPEKIPGLPR